MFAIWLTGFGYILREFDKSSWIEVAPLVLAAASLVTCDHPEPASQLKTSPFASVIWIPKPPFGLVPVPYCCPSP